MNTQLALLLSFGVSGLITFFSTPFVIKFAKAIGAIDNPARDDRRVHKEPTPRLGGLAMYLGFIIALFLFVPTGGELKTIGIASAIIVIMGVVDDTISLGAKVKLAVQILCALIAIRGGVLIEFFSYPWNREAAYYLDFLRIPVTVFWIVGITNTVNLVDGLDGLADGISIIAAFTLAAVAFLNGNITYTAVFLCLAGAGIGFLPFNFNPARIFMGDTGALFLGFILATASIEGTVKGATLVAVVVPVLALGIPILDTTFAIIRRKIAGKPIMKADKGHLHHRLLAKGLSQKQTVLVLYGFSAVLGASAVLISKSSLTVGIGIVLVDLLLILYGGYRLKMLKSNEE